MTEPVQDESYLIHEGDQVIIQKGEIYHNITVKIGGFISLEKTKIPISKIIGYPVGTSFSFDGTDVKPLENNTAPGEIEIEDLSVASSGDNRHLNDRSDNQILKEKDIHSLKTSGVSGNEIMAKLVEHSATFHLKTKYSQEKYLRKKKRMYLCVFTVRPYTARTLADMLSVTGRFKSTNLRYDSLAQLMMYANVHAGSNILLAESHRGLVAQAVLERLGSREFGGRLFNFYHGTSPPRVQLQPVEFYSKVYPIQFVDVTSLLLTGKFARLHAAATTPEDDSEDIETASANGFSGQRPECLPTCLDEDVGEDEGNESNPPDAKKSKFDNSQGDNEESRRQPISDRKSRRLTKTPEEKAANLARRLASFEEARLVLCPTDSEDAARGGDRPDSLIVVTRFYPVELTLLLLQFLPPGRPFVVHTHLLDPLVELYNILKRRGACIHLMLSDNWLRPVQVLPGRTHPEMRMCSGGGGFILRGYTVERTEDADSNSASLLPQSSIASSTRKLFAEGLISFAE